MQDVFAVADHIVTSLGFSTGDTLARLQQNSSGVSIYNEPSISPEPFAAARIDSEDLKEQLTGIVDNNIALTRLEQMSILSIHHAIQKSKVDPSSPDTLFIFSTTKGNIDILEGLYGNSVDDSRLYLAKMASYISRHFENPNESIVVSNACISGAMAIIIGARLIRSGRYKNVVAVGADIASAFTVSGFQSFKALSSKAARPFDADRDGLSLGEGCGVMVLTGDINAAKDSAYQVKVLGGAISNDANHISGPSRTGDGLLLAINKALGESGMRAGEIDHISTHGTATPYNDEMEAKAIHAAGLSHVPMNSIKGHIGHTLGAAGLIEAVVGVHSMLGNRLYPTNGFEHIGVSEQVNVIKQFQPDVTLNNFLKTASGFGGCNAAVIFAKA